MNINFRNYNSFLC